MVIFPTGKSNLDIQGTNLLGLNGIVFAQSPDFTGDNSTDLTLPDENFTDPALPQDNFTDFIDTGTNSTLSAVPEFGTLASIILIIAILSIVVISAKTKLRSNP
jgi:predicted secreted protein with PEFG-CTERM motif